MIIRNSFTTFLMCCFILVSNVINSQTSRYKAELDSLAIILFEATNNKDFDVLLDHTYPKIFDVLPKETMLQALKMTFEGTEDFKIDIPELKPEYLLSEVFTDVENNVDYAFISYDIPMTMTFKNQSFDKEGRKAMKSMMKLQGMEVSFISDNKLDILKENSLTILLNDEITSGTWKMINYNPDSPLFFKCLPTSVLEKAKDYYENLMITSKKEE